MGLKNRIGEHLLCVAIDLAEAQQELNDAQIKVEQLASKYNELINIKNKLDEDSANHAESEPVNNTYDAGSHFHKTFSVC
jgi:hypothetical protein